MIFDWLFRCKPELPEMPATNVSDVAARICKLETPTVAEVYKIVDEYADGLLKSKTPVELKDITCRFKCKSPPIGIFHVPEGCICWDDPIQALCAQHAINAESTGPITIIQDFRIDD